MKQIHICLLVASLLLVGCNASKRIAGDEKPPPKKSARFLGKQLEMNAFDFNSLSFRASMKVNLPDRQENLSLKASVRMRKDSVIWMSITATSLRYEVARLLITTDSIQVRYKTDASKPALYEVHGFDYLDNLAGTKMDFKTLQNVLVGNSIDLGESEKLRASVEGMRYLLSSLKKRDLRRMQDENEEPDDISYRLWVRPQDFRVGRLAIDDYQQERFLSVSYKTYQSLEDKLLPENVEIKASASERMEVDMEYKKPKVDPVLKFPFRIPKTTWKQNE